MLRQYRANMAIAVLQRGASTPINAFSSLPGIASDVIAPTYAELYAAESHSTCGGTP